MTHAELLIEHMRRARKPRAISNDPIDNPQTLRKLLRWILDAHLVRTAPRGEPARGVMGFNGYQQIPESPPPEFEPDRCDEAAQKLALLIGHLEDALGQKSRAA